MATTDMIIGFFVVVLCISGVYVMGQIAINDINPDYNNSIYQCKDGVFGRYMMGDGCNVIGVNVSLEDSLPSQTLGTNPTSGDIFTDTFNAARDFIMNKLGLGYVTGIILAPHSIIAAMGMPEPYTVILSAIFYLIMITLLAAWILGR